MLVSYVGYPFKNELWYKSVADLQPDELDAILRADLYSALNLARYALPAMRRSGGGVMILTSSTPALSGYKFGSAYSIAKLSVLGLVKAIAAEYSQHKVRAYALAPGNIKTRATYEKLSEEERTALAGESPMGRWGSPAEVAGVALALASDLFSYVNGQVVVIDGGTIMIS